MDSDRAMEQDRYRLSRTIVRGGETWYPEPAPCVSGREKSGLFHTGKIPTGFCYFRSGTGVAARARYHPALAVP